MPLGRCVPAGRLRWHILRAPEGSEQTLCDRLVRLLPAGSFDDVFVPRRERFIKRGGSWSLRSVPMWRGYCVATTRDSDALAKALKRMGAQGVLVGGAAEGWAPLEAALQVWLASVMDAGHVIRASVGRIDGDGLHVVFGPLVGQERRVVKVDRHHRTCWVRVCGVDISASLEVPAKDDVQKAPQL